MCVCGGGGGGEGRIKGERESDTWREAQIVHPFQQAFPFGLFIQTQKRSKLFMPFVGDDPISSQNTVV